MSTPIEDYVRRMAQREAERRWGPQAFAAPAAEVGLPVRAGFAVGVRTNRSLSPFAWYGHGEKYSAAFSSFDQEVAAGFVRPVAV